ncbi:MULTISPECIES: hypothetical protein [Bacillus cereus group]|uniref:hypothetical protein n=1 Tax=Bacillus cereus group TaxID=86661 RepID=UPI0022DF7EAA|nr:MULTISPECIES: hypothetical protein [unclassified Bacillus cereus group]MDA2666900.1 hypothetical protein [Bacillus cereus group sp. Bc032]MDA2677602.1 hypothetical protein [Bacillus cereus group sp. Bc031]MDA2683093.1 hypothetical protein [Bacillus cereus group sp. Bc029]MDA2688536.1 hypothetical protein [Bacillus cereus group sp. Bc030]MDA2744059.1 hypothetical protein [Bacillus cereus group sp. Bc011]
MKNKNEMTKEQTLNLFIDTCLDCGVSLEKQSELVRELINLIKQERHGEWMELADKFVEEAQSKEGAML